VAVAATAGEIGYLLAEALQRELAARDLGRPVVAVVTRVEVAADDPAMASPQAGGTFYDAATARELERTRGWRVRETPGAAGGKWWRARSRAQSSKLAGLRALLAAGCAVIAGGGGGVPVTREAGGGWRGVEAVIDKDRSRSAGARAGRRLAGHPHRRRAGDQELRPPRRASAAGPRLAAALRLQAQGQFPAAAWVKIEAAMDFVTRAERPALITSPEALGAALAGDSGTYIVPEALWLRGGPWRLGG
jgi:carbamate kinase